MFMDTLFDFMEKRPYLFLLAVVACLFVVPFLIGATNFGDIPLR